MIVPRFHVDWGPLAAAALLEGSYLLAVTRYAPRPHPEAGPAVTRRQVTWFTGGVVAVAVATMWPLHDLAEHYLFSMHMLQHLLLSLVAPPMLLLGMPHWLLRRLLSPRPAMAAARVVLRPFVALILFNVTIVVTHWPAWVNLTLENQPFHLFSHGLLFGTALCMWWPALSPLEELPGLSFPGRMLYLFLQSIVPTVPASFLTFGSQPLYSFYVHVPRIWGWSVLEDQTISGLIMKRVGGAILWAAIAVLFFKWYQLEHRDGVDGLRYRGVEHEISQELAKR